MDHSNDEARQPPGIPWEPREDGSQALLWRSRANPIIPGDLLERSNSIFNSAVVPYGDGFAGVFRVDDISRTMNIHAGRSADGVKWEIDPDPIRFAAGDNRVPEIQQVFEHAYDPRVVQIDDTYWVTWCNGYTGPTIGIAWTTDFEHFTQMENAFLPFNRNGVLFPRTIDGKYMMLSRPSDNGHTPFGDIYLSESPDMVHWGRHRFVMGARRRHSWESTKIGAGPVPIETDQGWLLIYHGVLTSCNGFVYAIGAALLDLDEPWKVLHRGTDYLLAPKEDYERVGDVPNVTFPCAALTEGDKLTVYYGAADTVVAMAHGHLSEIVGWLTSGDGA